MNADSNPPEQPHGSRVPPDNVPVFQCIVYISTIPSGEVQARVANLAGLQCTASTERSALSRLVPEFKLRVAELHRAGEPIAWIDPPLPAEPGEQIRYVPVHL